MSVTPNSLNFLAIGAANAQTTTVAESNYSGTFTATTPASGQPNSCASIASIVATTSTTFTVTPLAAGACTFTITGGNGQSAPLSISVTSTTVTGQ